MCTAYRSLPLLALTLVLASGCASLADGARRTFSRSLTCPLERVTSAPVRGRPWTPEVPPAEVAGDPGRLAQWQDRQARVAQEQAKRTYYVARGCDREITYYCYRDDSGPSCSAVDPKVPDWDLVTLNMTRLGS